MKVRLNLATSPLESNRRFTLGATVVGIFAVIALIVLSQRAYSVWSSDRAFRMRQEALQTQVASFSSSVRDCRHFFRMPTR